MTKSAQKVVDTLAQLGSNIHPLSSSGGWFATEIIAAKSGCDLSTVSLRLRELETAGVVKRQWHKHQVRWRLDINHTAFGCTDTPRAT